MFLEQFANNDAGWCVVMRKRVFATAMTSVHNWFLFVPFVFFSLPSEYEYPGNYSAENDSALELT